MSEYQAIYDAVRSRIHGGDIGAVAERVMRDAFDVSLQKALLQQAIDIVLSDYTAPSAIMRPTLGRDGDQWCALYGANIQEGVCGFGASPALACEAFDKAWREKIGGAK